MHLLRIERIDTEYWYRFCVYCSFHLLFRLFDRATCTRRAIFSASICRKVNKAIDWFIIRRTKKGNDGKLNEFFFMWADCGYYVWCASNKGKTSKFLTPVLSKWFWVVASRENHAHAKVMAFLKSSIYFSYESCECGVKFLMFNHRIFT